MCVCEERWLSSPVRQRKSTHGTSSAYLHYCNTQSTVLQSVHSTSFTVRHVRENKKMGAAININSLETSKSPFLSHAPQFPKHTAFRKVPRLRPFVLLARATYRKGQVWRIAGMIPIWENLSQCRFVHHTSPIDWTGIESAPPR